jgi:menaquinone-dependent protoporphyrinogen oxidase
MIKISDFDEAVYKRFKMKTAVIYTSKHGTAEKVARMIAERLTADQVSVINLKENKNPDMEVFEAILFGTSVYAGNASTVMQSFCKKNIPQLLEKRIALFVCGMEPNVDKQQQELANAYPLQLFQHAVSKHFVGGEFLFEKMNFFEREIIKRIAKTDRNVSQIKDESIDKLIEEFLCGHVT